MNSGGLKGFCKSPDSVRIQENSDQKKLRIWTLFTQCNYERTASKFLNFSDNFFDFFNYRRYT